ncbi:hypothetical protein AK812_SmicGene25516 [Symbiodinium microadriaticum]|uniref:Uncharacterized protein n=1 Tax=Symbiodinium microadriaticum TaxID=2951 RepID=A0A1Q9DBX0_SYMMI|nr:hypothetical protein AK812_SmicGene25516 [Symbiodinium microadriaticum]
MSSRTTPAKMGEDGEDDQEEHDVPQEPNDEQHEPDNKAMPEYFTWTDDWHDVYAQLLQIYDSSELNPKRRRIMDTLLTDLRKAKDQFDAAVKPMAAYRKALEEVKNHVMTELKTPIVITKETVSGSANDLPLQEHSHQYKAKTLVDIIENVALDAVPWESIPACLANDRYTELPPPFRTDICPDISFVLQISIITNTTGTFGTVIKHFIFAEKTNSLRNIDEVVHGTGYLIDYSPNFRSGPLHGWSAGLVKEFLRNHSASNVYARPVTNFFLTLHDVAAWLFDDVLVEILGDLKSHTLVMMGMAETGKTPVAQAIAMALSEYHILVGGKEQELQPSFRLVASLDQLRGEAGIKERPDILDDPDTSVMSVTKLKAFLVRNQFRVICNNRVNDDAEPDLPDSASHIKFDEFMDIIAPAFPDKSSKQDRMACLKRAHWVVNMKKALYLRPAGTVTGPVRRISYMHGQTDFLNDAGRAIMQAMRDGVETPPNDWIQKRQWTHDVLTMLIEKKERPPRTASILIPGSGDDGPTIRESKPPVLFSGRICPDFLPTGDTTASVEERCGPSSSLPATCTKVALKTEVEDKAFFPSLTCPRQHLPAANVPDQMMPFPTSARIRKTEVAVSAIEVVSEEPA